MSNLTDQGWGKQTHTWQSCSSGLPLQVFKQICGQERIRTCQQPEFCWVKAVSTGLTEWDARAHKHE